MVLIRPKVDIFGSLRRILRVGASAFGPVRQWAVGSGQCVKVLGLEAATSQACNLAMRSVSNFR